MKIIVLDGYTLNPGDLSWDGLKALGELTVYDRTPAGAAAKRIGGAEIVFTNKTPVTKETFDACPNIRFVGVLATGYNIVDTAAAKDRGIIVCNVPSYSTDSVAQLTIALLLEVCHHVGAHSEAVHNGEWTRRPDHSFWLYPLTELAGKTMGIIGYGRIGRAVGKIAQSLGMEVVYHSRHRKPEAENENCRYAQMDELFEKADVITLHCPLYPETQEMINKDSISKMKDGVILINTSRGQLIAEEDLADALRSGKIGSAAVDVAAKEPIPADSPLLHAPNCIITPHIAWAPFAARKRLMQLSEQNLKAFLNDKPINVVN